MKPETLEGLVDSLTPGHAETQSGFDYAPAVRYAPADGYELLDEDHDLTPAERRERLSIDYIVSYRGQWDEDVDDGKATYHAYGEDPDFNIVWFDGGGSLFGFVYPGRQDQQFSSNARHEPKETVYLAKASSVPRNYQMIVGSSATDGGVLTHELGGHVHHPYWREDQVRIQTGAGLY